MPNKKEGRLYGYIVVNRNHITGIPTVCDPECTVHVTYKEAKKERDSLRKEFYNPAIEVMAVHELEGE